MTLTIPQIIMLCAAAAGSVGEGYVVVVEVALALWEWASEERDG